MSLKAKLEAVIYAAEEPVTLAQLAALFTADALEWKAEQAVASAAESADAEPLPLLDEGFAYLNLEQTPATYTADPGTPESEPDNGTGTQQASESDNESGSASTTDETTPASSDAEPAGESAALADSEGELRRQARQRDREVRAILSGLLKELIADYAAGDHGVEIREIAGGFRMATKPECHDAVRMFVRSLKPALKLSLPALETLAVIAYKQPVTAPEVNEIRGVESNATLGSLLSRKLIATAGRKQVIGRPILYKTTREFLLRFGLKDVAELPSMEEFEKMAAIELDDSADEGAFPPDAAPETAYDGSLDFSEHSDDDPEERGLVGQGFSPDIDLADSHGALAPAPGTTASDPDSTTTQAALAAPSPAEPAETEALPQ
jgi:segregation and condensation protein B